MNLKELKDKLAIQRKIKEIKQQEYLIAEGSFIVAEAKYNLYVAEMELKRFVTEAEREKQNGN